jgi:hypothetical protein
VGCPFASKERKDYMAPICLGRVNVPTPGTAVPLATALTPCKRIRVSVVAGLTGKMYFGANAINPQTQQGVNHSTLAGVIKELWPNSAGGVDDSYEVFSTDGSSTLNLQDYAIDAVVADEGLIVSYWQ